MGGSQRQQADDALDAGAATDAEAATAAGDTPEARVPAGGDGDGGEADAGEADALEPTGSDGTGVAGQHEARNEEANEDEAALNPPSKLELLRGQLEAERLRGDELLRQVADARNEMEAVQRRSELQLERSRRHQMADFLRDLLPVLDELRQAVDAAGDAAGAGARCGAEDTENTLVAGISLTRRNLIELLRRNGLEEIDPQGQVFDPLFHEAISSVAAADSAVAANTVVQVVQRGYTLHDRLLRAARVVVAAPPQAGDAAAAEAEAEAEAAAEDSGTAA